MTFVTAFLSSLQEAEQVRDLFLEIYGEGYPVATYYQPEQLWAEHQAGRTLCAVSRNDQGMVVAHLAAYRSAPSQALFEVGAGLVSKKNRGGGAMRDLIRFMLAELRQRTQLLFAESVCNHIYSQHATVKMGFHATALEIDLMPAEAYQQEQSATGRVSTVLAFMAFADPPEILYLPTRYREALLSLYEGMNLTRQLESASGDPPSEPNSQVTDLRLQSAGLLRRQVQRIGQDFARHLEEDPAVFQLMLPLTSPHLDFAVGLARQKGFFFGGLLPRWTDQDTLLLQRLAAPPHWDQIQLYGKRAIALLETIRADYAD